MSKKLLPSGFHDTLAPHATRLQQLCRSLSNHFAHFGYEEVTPPLMEFEENLSHNASLQLSDQMFRALDPISNKMLALRSDFTAQIARIATTRLSHDALPLRLSYAGDVIRVNSETTHPARQLTHSGIEIIGSSDIAAEYEILYSTLSALKTLGLEDICLDLSLPTVIKTLLDNAIDNTTARSQIEQALMRKDLETIATINPEFSARITPLFETNITIDCLRSLPDLQAFTDLTERLDTLIQRLVDDFPQLTISIDPLEMSKFRYHSGISYALFARKYNLEISRGGRYIIDHENGQLDAVGATVYVDELLHTTSLESSEKRVLVAANTSYQDTEELRSQGYITLQQISSTETLAEEANKRGCTHIFNNASLTSIA